MIKSVSKKMGIKENSRAIFINAPTEAIEAIDLPSLDITSKLTDYFDYIHLFAKSESVFRTSFPELKAHLKPKGMVIDDLEKRLAAIYCRSIQTLVQQGFSHPTPICKHSEFSASRLD